MRTLVKWNLVILTLAAGLALATGAYADSLTWSVFGPGVVGGGSMMATNEGGGDYLVTGMTGSLTITQGSTTMGGAITAFTPFTGTLGTHQTDPTGLYNFDDMVIVSPSSPQLDQWGLLFNVAGFSNPLNLCGVTGCSTGNYPYVQWDVNVPGPGNNLGFGGNYNAYPVNFSATVTPEPSALGLLGLGLLGLMLVLGRERLRAS